MWGHPWCYRHGATVLNILYMQMYYLYNNFVRWGSLLASPELTCDIYLTMSSWGSPCCADGNLRIMSKDQNSLLLFLPSCLEGESDPQDTYSPFFLLVYILQVCVNVIFLWHLPDHSHLKDNLPKHPFSLPKFSFPSQHLTYSSDCPEMGVATAHIESPWRRTLSHYCVP